MFAVCKTSSKVDCSLQVIIIVSFQIGDINLAINLMATSSASNLHNLIFT